MQMNDLVLLEYEKRRKQLESKLDLKEEELKEKEKFISSLNSKKKDKYFGKYFIEKKYVGDVLLLHKKGLHVKIFSHEEDVTDNFGVLVKDILKLANADFVLKGTFVSLEEFSSTFYITDCLYYGRGLERVPLFERKKIIKSLRFSDKIKESGCVEVDNKDDAKKAIELFSDLSKSKEVIIRKFNSTYFSKTDFLEYLGVPQFNVLVLSVYHSKEKIDLRKYLIGARISKDTNEKFNSKSVLSFEEKWYHVLGETNETSILAEKGDCLLVKADAVLKAHISNELIQYSLKDSFVLEKTKENVVVSLSELELSLEEINKDAEKNING